MIREGHPSKGSKITSAHAVKKMSVPDPMISLPNEHNTSAAAASLLIDIVPIPNEQDPFSSSYCGNATHIALPPDPREKKLSPQRSVRFMDGPAFDLDDALRSENISSQEEGEKDNMLIIDEVGFKNVPDTEVSIGLDKELADNRKHVQAPSSGNNSTSNEFAIELSPNARRRYKNHRLLRVQSNRQLRLGAEPSPSECDQDFFPASTKSIELKPFCLTSIAGDGKKPYDSTSETGHRPPTTIRLGNHATKNGQPESEYIFNLFLSLQKEELAFSSGNLETEEIEVDLSFKALDTSLRTLKGEKLIQNANHSLLKSGLQRRFLIRDLQSEVVKKENEVGTFTEEPLKLRKRIQKMKAVAKQNGCLLKEIEASKSDVHSLQAQLGSYIKQRNQLQKQHEHEINQLRNEIIAHKEECTSLSKMIDLLLQEVSSLLKDVALGAVELKELKEEVRQLRVQVNDALAVSVSDSKYLEYLERNYSDYVAFTGELVTLLCNYLLPIADADRKKLIESVSTSFDDGLPSSQQAMLIRQLFFPAIRGIVRREIEVLQKHKSCDTHLENLLKRF